VDMDHYRDLSQGKLANEGMGLYLSSPVTINLSLFDFTDPNNPKYNGIPLPGNFNGVIFCEGDISLKGTLEGSYMGPSGKIQSGLTFFSNDDIIATGNIRTGNTIDSIQSAGSLTFNQPSGSKQTQTVLLDGVLNPDVNVIRFKVSGNTWDKMQMTILKDGVPMTRSDGIIVRTQLVRTGLAPENSQTAVINGDDLNELKFEPDHTYSARIDYYSTNVGDTTVTVDSCSGDPVNIGLVAKNRLFIHQNTQKQLTLDAAILARDNNWSALGTASDHPNGYDANIWDLTINGPIITKKGGDAGPWMTNGKRYYRYDMDMVENAPPYFPIPADWWLLAYWKHLKESEIKK